MKSNIMHYIGSTIFISMSWKYKNDKDKYLKIMKLDRTNQNNVGYNPFEYGQILRNKEEELEFTNNNLVML